MTNSVPAWRAPLTAIGLLGSYRVLSSVLIAAPLLFALRASGAGAAPLGDAPLFEPGALVLSEVLRQNSAALFAACETACVIFGVCAVLGLIPLAAAIDALSEPGRPRLAERLTVGVRAFPGFLALSGIALLTQGALLLGASIVGSTLSAAFRNGDERWGTLAPIFSLIVGALGAGCCTAVLDLARVSLLQRNQGAREALLDALARVRDRGTELLLGYYPNLAGNLFAVAVAAWLVGRADLSRAAAGPLVLAFAAHQLAVFFGIGLRVRFLGLARDIALEGAPPDSEDST